MWGGGGVGRRVNGNEDSPPNPELLLRSLRLRDSVAMTVLHSISKRNVSNV